MFGSYRGSYDASVGNVLFPTRRKNPQMPALVAPQHVPDDTPCVSCMISSFPLIDDMSTGFTERATAGDAPSWFMAIHLLSISHAPLYATFDVLNSDMSEFGAVACHSNVVGS